MYVSDIGMKLKVKFLKIVKNLKTMGTEEHASTRVNRTGGISCLSFCSYHLIKHMSCESSSNLYLYTVYSFQIQRA